MRQSGGGPTAPAVRGCDMIGSVLLLLSLTGLAVVVWIIITALDTSSCFDCGHEFGPGEDVHIIGHRLGIRVLCGRCSRTRAMAHKTPPAHG